MSDLKLDLDPTSPNFEDLSIEEGDLVLIDGPDEILQHCLQRLKTFFEEWFLDTTVGVPYTQQILVKNPDQGKIDALLLNEIYGTPGILEVLEFSTTLKPDIRGGDVSFKARSTAGIIDYRGLVP